MRKKYSIEPYRSLLLNTGSRELHEKPIRGSGNNWTLPGSDWLGLLLMEIREEITPESSNKRPAEDPAVALQKRQRVTLYKQYIVR